MTLRLWLLSLCTAMACLCTPTLAKSALKALKKDAQLSAEELAKRINERIEARWAEENAKPAPRTSDAEFLRRVYLDLRGRIPHVSELHTFLDNKDPQKRLKKINQLLRTTGFINNFAFVWRRMMLPQTNNRLVTAYSGQLETWLKRHFRNGTGYDEMVRELLTAPINFQRRVGQQAQQYDPSVRAFYQANNMKPEDIAAATSRLFLGVRLECAQCHDHPFNTYSRKQFWEYTAFFAGIQPARRENNRFIQQSDDPTVREVTIPGTKRTVKARFLDGSDPKWDEDAINARETLAEWMTSPDNPYFAKASVNRFWAHFFGVGLVDPVDEMSDDNPGSHPELLEEMAQQFVRSGFDIRYMIRAITLSDAYQLSSKRTDESQDDITIFARMNLKGMTPEQLYESLVVATGYQPPTNGGRTPGFNPFGLNTPAAEIRNKFSNFADRRTEYQTSILQALTLMNGKFINDATSLSRSEKLMGIIDSPFMSTKEKLEAMFLTTLSRKPSPEQASRLLTYIEKGGPSKNSNKAMADVLWALLNSSEFILNH